MDIRLEHRYEDERKIMKHVSEMNEQEKNELNRLIENRRLQEINKWKQLIAFNEQNKDYVNECTLKQYEREVKENNNHFCACGIRCKSGMGKTKFRCGKEVCQLYEHKK